MWSACWCLDMKCLTVTECKVKGILVLELIQSGCNFKCKKVLAVSVTQVCPTLCNPMDYNPPGSSIHGILQARILEWIAIPFCRRSSRPRDWTQVSCIAGRFFTVWATRKPLGYATLSHFSHVWLCATPQTVAYQAPPSLGFSRQEHWSRLPFPSSMHESEKWKWSRSVVSDS